MFYKTISTAGNEPLSLADVKVALKIDTPAIDERLKVLIQSARSYIETLAGVALIQKTVEVEVHPVNPRSNKLVTVESTGEVCLTVPISPLIKVDRIQCEGKEIRDYRLIENQKIVLPAFCLNRNVVMTLTVGYGANDFPPVLKETVMMTVLSLYEKGEFPPEESLLKLVRAFRIMNLH